MSKVTGKSLPIYKRHFKNYKLIHTYTYNIYNDEKINRYMYKHATYNTDIFFIL